MTAPTILRAAELLEREAEALRQSHTIGGVWDEAEADAKAEYDEMVEAARALRQMHELFAVVADPFAEIERLRAEFSKLNTWFDAEVRAGNAARNEVTSLKAEIERLREQVKEWTSANARGGWIDEYRADAKRYRSGIGSEAIATIGRLRAERAALRADAERYRWLREHGATFESDPVNASLQWRLHVLDAAIDAAREEK